MKTIQVDNKKFSLSITREKIQEAVRNVADKLTDDLKDKDPIFLGILNGSFMFASDLFQNIEFPAQITFLKVASYQGTSSSGNVKRLIGVNEDLSGKTVVILEDIIDSGRTIEHIVKQLKGYEPKEIKIATFLLKPEVYDKEIEIDYVGMEIPNDFIVGYGLDYNGYGRNLPEIYTVVE